MNTSHASLFESGGLHVVSENTLKSLNLVFVFRRLRAVTSLGKLGRGGGGAHPSERGAGVMLPREILEKSLSENVFPWF